LVRTLVTREERSEWDSLGDSRTFELEGGFPERERLLRDRSDIPEEADEFFDISIDSYLGRLDDDHVDGPEVDAATERRLRDLGGL
jgi:hypothetical protein